jgi:hypothetical protein
MNENVSRAMRQVADNANQERINSQRNAAEQWVDTVALSAVKRTAERGEYHYDIQVPANIHKGYVEGYIKTGGFDIEGFGKHSRYIRIKW